MENQTRWLDRLIAVYSCAFFFVTSSSFASENRKYKCTITHLVDQFVPTEVSQRGRSVGPLISDGSNSFPWSWFSSKEQLQIDGIAKLYVGKVFWVDSSTGAISGDISSDTFASAKVVSQGNQEWSFKVIHEGHSLSEGHRHVMFLEIYDYALSNEKPFLGAGMTLGSSTVLGKCVASL
jgi:hypothetical protein